MWESEKFANGLLLIASNDKENREFMTEFQFSFSCEVLMQINIQ